MIVLVLTACPEGLRGHLTRWLMEVSPGVYVGHVTRRVREELWQRVHEYLGSGRALMVWSAQNEQRFSVASYGHDWVPVDYDGITLMRRPADATAADDRPHAGWSTAGRRRRYGAGGGSRK